MPAFHKLPEALGHLIDVSGKSAREIAALAGIQEGRLSLYRNGKSEPSLTTLGKLLQALRVNLGRLDELLDWFAAGPPSGPSSEPPPAMRLSGVWVEGHVVTAAEAEVGRQLLQALERLRELALREHSVGTEGGKEP